MGKPKRTIIDLSLHLTVDAPTVMPGDWSEGPTIQAGTTVEYVAHVIGGMVKVRHEGREYIINPNATRELCEGAKP